MKRIVYLTVFSALCLYAPVHGQIPITTLGSPYTQNFDSLANTGTSSTVPTGWAFVETGTSANTTYAAGNGGSSTGNTYSFGLDGSTERAFGGLLMSGSLIPTIGARFVNNTGQNITSLAIAYVGEQWRLGNHQRGQDRIDFQYSLDAASLTTGAWTDVNELDFATPNLTGLGGPRNGNLPENRSAIAHTIIGLNIPSGTTFWIRWTDFDAPNSDDGLAVDDFSLTAFGPGSRTYVVDTLLDDGGLSDCTDDPGDCSLRGAISIATDGDTIEFDIPAPLGGPQTIVLDGGSEIVLSSDIEIIGPGADQLTIDGGPGTNRIFTIGNSFVTISGLTLTGGGGFGINGSGGGAIDITDGSVSLEGLNITGNTSAAASSVSGGVMFRSGSEHTILNSSITNNTAPDGCGGGITVSATAVVELTNSTVSGNSAAQGGAICLMDETFTKGSAIDVRNSTITANQSGGAAVFAEFSSMTFGGSIIAGNIGAQKIEIWRTEDVFGFTSFGFNLIGDSDGDAANTGFPILYLPADILDTPPLLGPLANNGGPTPTHRLLATSPAIDKGNSFGLATDQRGFARVFNFPGVPDASDGADIGAFENLGPTAAEVSVAGRVSTAKGTAIRGASVTIFGGDLVQPVTVTTGAFGRFSFTGLRAGQTYVVMVSAGRYTFIESVRTVVPTDNVDDLDFVSN